MRREARNRSRVGGRADSSRASELRARWTMRSAAAIRTRVSKAHSWRSAGPRTKPTTRTTTAIETALAGAHPRHARARAYAGAGLKTMWDARQPRPNNPRYHGNVQPRSHADGSTAN